MAKKEDSGNVNPIQANPSNPRNPNRELEGDADAKNVPKDQDPAKGLVKEIERLERRIKRKESVKPHLAPVRTPKKSDTIETQDGKAIMDELEEMGKRLNSGDNEVGSTPPQRDGSGPHGKGLGPGNGEAECRPKHESVSVKDYLRNSKELQHQIQPFTEKRVYISDPSQAPSGANVQQGARGGHYYDTDGVNAIAGQEEPDVSVDLSDSEMTDVRNTLTLAQEREDYLYDRKQGLTHNAAMSNLGYDRGEQEPTEERPSVSEPGQEPDQEPAGGIVPAEQTLNNLSSFVKGLDPNADIRSIGEWSIDTDMTHGEKDFLSIGTEGEGDDVFSGDIEELMDYIKQEYPNTTDFEFNTETELDSIEAGQSQEPSQEPAGEPESKFLGRDGTPVKEGDKISVDGEIRGGGPRGMGLYTHGKKGKVIRTSGDYAEVQFTDRIGGYNGKYHGKTHMVPLDQIVSQDHPDQPSMGSGKTYKKASDTSVKH